MILKKLQERRPVGRQESAIADPTARRSVGYLSDFAILVTTAAQPTDSGTIDLTVQSKGSAS
jgi:hypothetical protein